jgi:hypothetical protein
MVAETQITGDTTEAEVPEERPARNAPVDFDTRLMPTCMIVMMVVGLGSLILIMLFWGIQNIGSVFR